ncbi:MAG: hypothetical protein A2925_03700 [Candidatus Yanofskybacteria bacterium RIFCSPLOWO2_01_FULL_44_22]|uniref:Uncharacterized protein n=2 Tax=Candidatus Yanofskyibacteriota TaxID=1752733 RepID=A0A1F8GMM5_9BACT|nr:MAG: hypothetical protein UW79_C0010G0030 [Candidatus Yanofskybacteria bacterium GW2011_GWA2_44_9]OGN04729.1 MAG: hypothetical protein A2659_01225 [Candidatus Yanofskybacteria bacterium RIFCSPHIGHO2_01_FULL_44_24]OGN26662.1 MAG: hypothetical protein A2925_03700 [Candidatus Yanofskybacteria bacterium RIFCSPLOWO2_01_FULL_44_22]
MEHLRTLVLIGLVGDLMLLAVILAELWPRPMRQEARVRRERLVARLMAFVALPIMILTIASLAMVAVIISSSAR